MHITDFLSLMQNVKGNGPKYTARCPAHSDKQNSLSVAVGEDGRILLHCHAGCDISTVLTALDLTMGDLFNDERNDDEKSAGRIRNAKRARGEVENANAKKKPRKPALQKASRPAAETEQANTQKQASRAGSEVDVQICKLGEVVYLYTDVKNNPLFETVRISFSDGSKSFRQRRRGEDGQLIYNLKDIEPVLYRLPSVRREIEQGGGEVWLCEGEKDADALAELDLCATTSPMGAGKWRPAYTEALTGSRRVNILPDNDKPGRAHAMAVAEALTGIGIEVRIVDLKALYPPLPSKGDVSDVLEALGPAVVRQFASNSLMPEEFEPLAAQRDEADEGMPYRFDTAAGYMEKNFWEDLERNRRQTALTTGFASLDGQFDGHMYPGLYVIGSVSSLGKTAFCLQMADHMAAFGQDVLFFTLEMSRMEMVARSLSRQLFVAAGCRGEYNVGHVLYDKVPKEELAEAVRVYHAGAAQRLAYIEGGFGLTVEDVAKMALAHLAATGRRPVVFVDYLQILRPPDVRMSDKQATDLSVVTLKRLSRQLDAPVVAVSSFNRQNYSEEVNMAAFKESGAIEYSADFVLGLQARGVGEGATTLTDEKKLARMVQGQTKSAKQQDPRPLEAVTLKNRRGPATASFEVDFYPRQNLFVEV